MDPATAREVIDRALPGRRVERLDRPATGNSKWTAFATLSDGERVVVHCQRDDDLLVEAALLRAVTTRTDVPVPTLLATGVLDDVAYLVAERASGEDLHERFTALDPAERTAVARTLGRHLGALHETFTFEGFGLLDRHGGALAVDDAAPDWPTAFLDMVEAGAAALGPPLASLGEAVLETVRAGRDALPAHPTPRLFPWDYRPGNVVVEDATVRAILDWGTPRTAHREFSLAKAEYLLADWYVEADAEAEAVRDAFHEGYRTELSIPAAYWTERRRLYRLGAIVRAAYDSKGLVTRPRYPMVPPDDAEQFHAAHLRELL